MARTHIALLVAAVAIVILGVAYAVPGLPVYILTSDGPSDCYLNFIEGDLTTDSVAGTAITEHGQRFVVMWPDGWTGRQSPFGVAIIDERGDTVARTGTHVRIGGAQTSSSESTWLACWVIQP